MSKKNKPASATPFGDAVAYSYTRFSSKAQRGGASTARQSDGPEGWCERNGVRLSHQSYADLGISAWTGEHRRNPDRNGLALFLNGLQENPTRKIARGSILIVENLDRLTREELRPAFTLANSILEAGIHIVTLRPERVYRHDATGYEAMGDVMMMLAEFVRANEESARKSFLVGDAWGRKKVKAREKGTPLTHKLPAWVELVDSSRDERGRLVGGRLVLIPERAAVVRQVFALSAAGYGHAGIVAKMIADGVAPIGTGDKWSKSYVALLLKDRRALGEFQPRKRDGSADGEPIPHYFPPVVEEADFFAVRGEAAKRRTKPGRIGTENVNIFAGLLVNGREGDSYHLATRTDGMRKGRAKDAPTHQQVLINSNSAEGRSPCYSFPYLAFERGILGKLREVNPREVVGESPAADEVLTLSGELAVLEGRERELEAALEEGAVAVVVRKLRELQTKKADLVKALEAAKARAASPLSEAWGEGQSLLGLLDNATDADDVRIRLRSVLRRVISQMYCVVFSKGKTRGVAVQVVFAGGEARRDYLLLYRPAIKGFNNSVKPAALVARSGTGFDWPLDLSKPGDCLGLAASLVARLERGELVV